MRAVQLGEDSFLINSGTCATNSPDAKTATTLRAGDLVGGVRQATPGGKRATINGQEVYAYTFEVDDLLLPRIRVSDGGLVTLTGGELWISPNTQRGRALLSEPGCLQRGALRPSASVTGRCECATISTTWERLQYYDAFRLLNAEFRANGANGANGEIMKRYQLLDVWFDGYFISMIVLQRPNRTGDTQGGTEQSCGNAAESIGKRVALRTPARQRANNLRMAARLVVREWF